MNANEPVAWINVEKRRLEWDKPTLWETPTIVKLDRIPLYTHPADLTNEEINEIIRVEANKDPAGIGWTLAFNTARAILKKAQE
jgi:hypothetical protein